MHSKNYIFRKAKISYNLEQGSIFLAGVFIFFNPSTWCYIELMVNNFFSLNNIGILETFCDRRPDR